MDFLKLLRSLEEFLYELCTWLLLFPRTLYRVAAHPLRMADYVDRELGQAAERQFDDAISPPLFLMLAVLVAHGVELLMHQAVPGTSELSREILGNEQLLLLYRSVTFAIWPLIASAHMLRRTQIPATRESLRRPFFTQCYLAAPFAVVVSTAFVFVRMPGATSTAIGLAAAALACAWYVVVQARWLEGRLRRPWVNIVLSTLWVLLLGLTINTAIALLILWPDVPKN